MMAGSHQRARQVGDTCFVPELEHPASARIVYDHSAEQFVDLVRTVWKELDRALSSDGQVLLAFQAGQNDRVERLDAYGSATTLMLYRRSPEDVTKSLRLAGFDVRADIRRQAELHETTPQAFLFARGRRS